MSALNNTDLKQLEALNISAEQVERQINQFKSGFPFSDLIAPATTENGIVKFNEASLNFTMPFSVVAGAIKSLNGKPLLN